MTPRPSRRTSHRSMRAGGLALVIAVSALVAPHAAAQSESDLGGLVTQRRSARIAAEARLDDRTEALAALDAELEARFASAADLAADLEAARSELRDAVTNAYVTDGGTESSLIALAQPDAHTASLRSTFLEHRAGDLSDAATRFDALKRDNDPALVAMVERREALAAEVDNATNALAQAKATEADAERMLAAAEAQAAQAAAEREAQAAAARAAERATTTAPAAGRSGGAATRATAPSAAAPTVAPTTTRPAPIVVSSEPSAPLPSVPEGGPTEEQWAALRRCESGGNYQIVSASGLYRGAYQFDVKTWASLGGTGDPAAAPPAEQDARAKLLYFQRGWKPWPSCGRYLQ